MLVALCRSPQFQTQRCVAQPRQARAAFPPLHEPTRFERQDHGGPKKISVLNHYNFHFDLQTQSLLSGHTSDATKYLIVNVVFHCSKVKVRGVAVRSCRQRCRSLNCSFAIFTGALAATPRAFAQAQAPANPPPVTMPQIVLSAPKIKPKPRRTARRRAPPAAPANVASANAIAQNAVLTAVPGTPAQVGNWPVGVPRYIFNVWTTYDFATNGIHRFRVGGLSYNSLSCANSGNTSWVPPSTVIDAMFGYCQPHWDAQIGIKNIGNDLLHVRGARRRLCRRAAHLLRQSCVAFLNADRQRQ
jgi:hypothetical protein